MGVKSTWEKQADLKGVVERRAVAALALGMEPVMEVDRLGLVIASQQKEVLRVFDLIGEEQRDRFNALRSTVHVVAKEEIVDLRREAMMIEHTQQIRVLNCTLGKK